jgi:nucleotide-binding universal stress UspA family protein
MTPTFKDILLAYDGSPCARSALATALTLAKAELAKITICTVVDPIAVAGANAPMPPTQAALDEARAEAKKMLDEAVASARSAGAEAEGQMLEGEPAFEIVGYAQRSGADAIVMGTHGRSGLKRLFLGSVAEETLRSAGCPVVIVHQK